MPGYDRDSRPAFNSFKRNNGYDNYSRSRDAPPRGGYEGRRPGDRRYGDRGQSAVDSLYSRHEHLYPGPESALFKAATATASVLQTQGEENDYTVYDNVSVKVEMPRDVSTPVPKFSEFSELQGAPYSFDSSIFANIARAGYTKPTPIQSYSLPIGILGYDLLACSQTGSGKTFGFLAPMLHNILAKGLKRTTDTPSTHFDRSYRYNCAMSPNPDFKPGRSGYAKPFCVILSPTRELTQQIAKAAWMLSYRTPVVTRVCYGGDGIGPQCEALRMGCDVLVATPGRLIDLLNRGDVIDLTHVRFLILDESDRMLDMGFDVAIREIIGMLPPATQSAVDAATGRSEEIQRQTLFFSATFPARIQQMAREYLRPGRTVSIAVGEIGSTNKNIVQHIVSVTNIGQKKATLLDIVLGRDEGVGQILTRVYESGRGADEPSRSDVSQSDSRSRAIEESSTAGAGSIMGGATGTPGTPGAVDGTGVRYQTIVFVNMKSQADEICYLLRDNGVRACAIHGDMQQAQREHSLRQFKERVTSVLVATDVAQRGLDVPSVRLVINFDMPNAIEDYTHRIGRTGRAGRPGVAVTFLSLSADGAGAARDLARKLRECNQPVPDWLQDATGRGGREGGYGRGRGYGSGHGQGSGRGGYGQGGSRGPRMGQSSSRGGGGGGGGGAGWDNYRRRF